MSDQTTEENDGNESETDDERAVTALAYERAVGVHDAVRERTAPVVTAADAYLRPALASKATALVIAFLVGAITVGGGITFVDRTLPWDSTATPATIGLVAVVLVVLAAGAVSWGGRRRTPYW